jgi:adenine-specific DNA-methyltransferase
MRDKNEMDGKSLNITDEKLNKLKEIIPEAFTENKIDWEKLKAALGGDIEFKNERYVLNWAGKSDAFRVLQSPTTATLVPERDESINFDTTENIFIEGENLEVLKVLQKAYFGKIKMIYIDPPYNTGNDNFIYPDKFSETKEEYLSRIGDKDETGYLTREGLFHKNSKDNGHYHSNWLSMMYPRLFLARNLLRDDGVIFISIDDNEIHNLRLLMNEVFGEENFIGQITVQSNPRGRQSEKFFATVHDYIIVYARNSDSCIITGAELSEKQLSDFKFEDEKNRKYRLLGLRQRGSASLRKDRPLMYFPIYVNPNTNKISLIQSDKFNICVVPKKSTGQDGRWMWSKEKVLKDIERIEAKLISTRNEYDIFVRDYLEKEGEERKRKIKTIWNDKLYNTQNGTTEVKFIFDGKKIFDFPKGVNLLKAIVGMVLLEETDICLDFFTGSGTTAHAIFDLNKKDNGKRKFICVQLPEKCDEKSEAYKAGYKTIAEIGKERIRRAIKKIKKEQEDKLNFDDNADKQDLGFKVFKLHNSNFKIWQTKIENEEQLVEQLQQHLEPLDEHAKIEDVLYELLLKSGIPLTAKIEEKGGFYLMNDNEIALILEKIDKKIIKKVIDVKPQKVITIDRLFKNNDQLKTNTALQMKDAGIEFKVV